MARKTQTALASAIAGFNKMNTAPFAQGGVPQRLLPTYTPLDKLLGGGLQEGSVTLVVGEVGQGKTALLQYLKNRIEILKPFKFGRSVYIGFGANQGQSRYAWAAEFDDLIDLVERCKQGSKIAHPAFFLDDVAAYAVANSTTRPGSSARMWSHLLLKTWKDYTLVLGVQAQRGVRAGATPKPGGGKALQFAAGTVLNVNIAATIPNGVVLNVHVAKSRWAQPGGSCLLSIVMDETGLWTEEIP